MTTADYLNQLEQDRQDLVDNLETQGISGLSGDETFTELVPEVLNIETGGGSEYNGHYDTTGLEQMGWTSEDIQYYQDNAVEWNSDKDSEYQVRADEISGTVGNKTRFLKKSSTDWYLMGYNNLLGIPYSTNIVGKTNIGSSFQNCYNLITIPLLNISSATSTYGLFENCYNLKSIPLLDTSNVNEMSRMFIGCYKLKTIPLLDTHSATKMDFMFYNCYNLEKVPLLNTNACTTFKSMFYYCYGLREVPQFNTSSVTTFESMFAYCFGLVSVPEFDTSSATNMGNMFNGCYNLSDQSLYNILNMCKNSQITNFKTLSAIGISPSIYRTRIQALSNYQDFLNAGWTIGN